MLLQASFDPSTIKIIIAFTVGFIGGMAVPTYYGIERVSGFGRWVADRLPYVPPPGENEDDALEKTTEEAEDN